jgi:guanylate kinase
MSSDAAEPVPHLVVVSAPSGAGKSTLCEMLLSRHPRITYSISCTTRPPRGREQHGREYYFLSREEFERRAAAGEFLEHATVHGCRYGTLRETVLAAMSAGMSVLMDIDVAGAAQIREAVRTAPAESLLRRGFVDVFIAPPSLDILRERLVGRGEDDADVIETRLRNARAEMDRAGEYRYTVVNDVLVDACARLEEILRGEGAIA